MMRTYLNFKFYHLITALILISLSVIGSDCDKLLDNNAIVPEAIIGDWILDTQTGALQDICSGETVKFQSTNIALLTCPNAVAISRDFTIENSMLKYTQTAVNYEIEILNSDTLSLKGQNVSRNLVYLKIPATDKPHFNLKESESNNSSEVKK